jgi:UDP-N-acetylglucosamine 2-epimerase (non-hydrolysing)
MAVSDAKFLTEDSLAHEICVVVGTRPGIIMMAPIIHALARKGIPHFVLHTGQHYSPSMDSELFEDLNLPQPAYHLDNVSTKTTHGGQTAAMIEGCEAAMIERRPRLVLVNGDANTNLAGALAARKLRLGLGHVEAGERSYDWRMPEEHNRRIMDHISDLLFATGEKGAAVLRQEHVQGAIHVTGNTIVDASLNHAPLAVAKSDALDRFGLFPGEFVLMTSHREENVDDPQKLGNILQGAAWTAERLGQPVVFTIHPRTHKRAEQFGLTHLFNAPGLRAVAALRYLDFLQLLVNCRLVLTDSGGVQQEAFIHRKPCVTMRDNTEWTETLRRGNNRLSGADSAERIVACVEEALAADDLAWPSIFGDGKAAERIVDISADFLDAGARA